MRKIGLACLLLLILATGCNWIEQIALKEIGVSKIKMDMGKGVLLEVKAKVDNGSNRYLALTDVDGEIYTEEGVVARVSLADTCRLAAHTEQELVVPLTIHLSDPLLLLKIGLNLSPQVLEGFYVKGTADVQVSRRENKKGSTKQIQVPEMPLTQMADKINLF